MPSWEVMTLPEADDDLELTAELLRPLKARSDGVAAKIREANRTTEREVLAIGESLRLIVAEARSHVEQSRATLEGFASANLTFLLEKHGTAMAQFVQRMQSQVTEQSRAARQATDQINRIVALGGSIERITMESKILALNANIQARRLGVAGDSFHVIAQEMMQFSMRVNEASKGIRELAEGLLEVLPRIESLAGDLRTSSEDFSHSTDNRVNEVAAVNTEMKEQVEQSMAAGESRLEQIIKLTYEALSHLQFQDPVAQDLMSCDKEVQACLQLVETWVAQGRLVASGSPAEVTTTEEENADSSLQSGEVMLF